MIQQTEMMKCLMIEFLKIYKISKKYSIYKSKVKLATVVEGYPKAPFSIASTARFSGGRYSFPWFSPLSLVFSTFPLILIL